MEDKDSPILQSLYHGCSVRSQGISSHDIYLIHLNIIVSIWEELNEIYQFWKKLHSMFTMVNLGFDMDLF